MAPDPIFLIDTTFFKLLSSLFLCCTIFTLIVLHYSIRLVLQFQQDRKIDNLLGKFGQERVFVLCAGSALVGSHVSTSNLVQDF